jgi:integrase/recombinase XerD
MYRRDTKAYTVWAKSQQLDPLVPSTFARFRTSLATVPYNDKGDKYSPRTINRMLSAVKAVVREAAVQGYMGPQGRDLAKQFDDVTGVRVVAMKDQVKKSARVRVSPSTMRAIVNQPDVQTLLGIRDRAFLLVLASSGVRVDDAVSLTRDQLEVRDDGFGIMVLGKNQTEPQFRPLTVEAWNAVQKWLDRRPVDSDFVFVGSRGPGRPFTSNPMSAVGAWKLVRKYAGRVDPQLGKTIKPHDFRRFVGTQLVRTKGVDVAQKVLGHADARTTLNNYVLPEDDPTATEGLF